MTTGSMVIPERNVSTDGRIVVEYEDARRPPIHWGHAYFLRKPYDRRVPSVTTIIGAYDKPALPYAASTVTIEGVASLHYGSDDPEGFYYNPQPQEFDSPTSLADALYQRELRHFQVWKKKADRGTFVHAVNQAWVEHGKVPLASEVPADYHGCIRAFGDFVRDHAPEFIRSEEIVASVRHGYAGRYDVVCRLTRHCDRDTCTCPKPGPRSQKKPCNGGETCRTVCSCWKMAPNDVIRLDYKTNAKAVYAENMAQLDLYEVAAIEMGEEACHQRCVLRLAETGEYELQVSRLPLGKSVGLIAGYRAKEKVERLHWYLKPPKGSK